MQTDKASQKAASKAPIILGNPLAKLADKTSAIQPKEPLQDSLNQGMSAMPMFGSLAGLQGLGSLGLPDAKDANPELKNTAPENSSLFT